MAIGDSDPLLPPAIVRGIGDKLYEKRKSAALEVEQLVKVLAAQENTARIGAIIDKLIQDFAFSPQANYRKGGLLCLAASGVPRWRLAPPPPSHCGCRQEKRVEGGEYL
jgi:vacuole morphology and inheritance protein 14